MNTKRMKRINIKATLKFTLNKGAYDMKFCIKPDDRQGRYNGTLLIHTTYTDLWTIDQCMQNLTIVV